MKPKETSKSSGYETLQLLFPEFYEALSGTIRKWGVPFNGLPPTSSSLNSAEAKGE